MNSNDNHETNLSALLDGELQGEELLRGVDALVEDPELRDFWRSARSLQKGLAQNGLAESREPLPEGMWEKIESRAKSSRSARVYQLFAQPRAWAAAASIVLLLGLGALGLFHELTPTSAGARTVELASAEGQMTEERFIELTLELLQSDPRYHRKMFQVMKTVQEEAYGRRETRYSETEYADRSLDQAEENRSSRGSETTTSTSDPIEFNMW